ncbi:hypothetical protein [Blastococcus sp. SYSU DS1024]
MSPSAVPSTAPARPHHLSGAGLAVVVAGLVAGPPAVVGEVGTLAAVLVLQLALVLSWVLATGMQGFAASLAVGTAAAVAADLALALPEDPGPGGLLAVLGVGFLAAVLQQMLRTPRHDLVDSLAGSAVLLTAVGALAVLLPLGRADDGRLATTALVAGVALLVGHLVDQVLPRPQLAPGVPRGLLGIVLAVLAGAGTAWAVRDLAELGALRAPAVGAVVAGVVALVAVAGSYLAVETTTEGRAEALSPWAPTVVQVVLPFAACAPVALALLTVL